MIIVRVSHGLLLDDAGQTSIINLQSEVAALKATVAGLMENINSECCKYALCPQTMFFNVFSSALLLSLASIRRGVI